MQRLHKHRTEPVVVIGIAIITVEIEQTSTIAIIPSTTANEERIIQRRKVRAVQLNPYISLNFQVLKAPENDIPNLKIYLFTLIFSKL